MIGGYNPSTPSPGTPSQVAFVPTAYGPGTGADREGSAGEWLLIKNYRSTGSSNIFRIGTSAPLTNFVYTKSSDAWQGSNSGGNWSSTFTYAIPDGAWMLMGLTANYSNSSNETTEKIYINGDLKQTNVHSGNNSGLFTWAGNSGDRMQSEVAFSANQDYTVSYAKSGAAFVVRDDSLTAAEWLQLYDEGT
jgi:hypothetical protein